MEILRGINLNKSYRTKDGKNTVLQDVSVTIEEGEFVSVMGPSGSGKTTLLFVLSGMDAPDGGTVTFGGRDLSGLSEKELADVRRKEMGFVFQQPTLLKNLSLLDNILLPSLHDHKGNPSVLTAKARSLMEETGIGDLGERSTAEVSGGQLQRAGICRALMSDPGILFCDEPTGALNSAASQQVMDILSAVNAAGTAVLLVTHDPNVAARSGRVLFMRDGAIEDELKLPPYD